MKKLWIVLTIFLWVFSGLAIANSITVEPLGQLYLNKGSFFVEVQDNYAYISKALSVNTGDSSSDGITIADVKDPSNPFVVAHIGNTSLYANSLLGDVKVAKLNNDFYKGNLLVIGIQNGLLVGLPGGLTAIDLWNITDPTNPQQLAMVPIFGPVGAHEVKIFTQKSADNKERTYVAVNSIGSEFASILFGLPFTIGDLQIYDITNPSHPTFVNDWAMQRDGGFATGVIFGGIGFCVPAANCRGSTPLSIIHTTAISKDGKTAFITMEDQGAAILDISDLSNIKLISHLDDTLVNPEGDDDHIAVSENGKTLMITSETNFHVPTMPGDPAYTGAVKFWNISDPAHPVYLTTFTIPIPPSSTPGAYTSRELHVHGNTLYVTWYTGGIYMLDISNPAQPNVIGHYLPPAVNGILPQIPGMAIDKGKIYITNTNEFNLYLPFNGVTLYTGQLNETN